MTKALGFALLAWSVAMFLPTVIIFALWLDKSLEEGDEKALIVASLFSLVPAIGVFLLTL